MVALARYDLSLGEALNIRPSKRSITHGGGAFLRPKKLNLSLSILAFPRLCPMEPVDSRLVVVEFGVIGLAGRLEMEVDTGVVGLPSRIAVIVAGVVELARRLCVHAENAGSDLELATPSGATPSEGVLTPSGVL